MQVHQALLNPAALANPKRPSSAEPHKIATPAAASLTSAVPTISWQAAYHAAGLLQAPAPDAVVLNGWGGLQTDYSVARELFAR